MKNLITLSLALVFLPCTLAACANAQTSPSQGGPKIESVSNIDLSTDEAVLAEMQKRADAKRAEIGTTGDTKLDAKLKNSSKLDARSVCIRRVKESPKVIVIGVFRTDYGCSFDGAFVGSRYFEATDVIDLSKAALAEFGWLKANQTKREILALGWVEKGLLAFFTVLYTKDVDFGRSESAFHPPQRVSAESGKIKITLWIQVPSGMGREKGFQYLEYTFAADGSFTGSKTLESLVL